MGHDGNHQDPPRWAWITYQTLVWLGIVLFFVSLAMMTISVFRDRGEVVFFFANFLKSGIGLIHLVACFGAVLRKSWAPHFIKVLCVWMIVSLWKHLFLTFNSLLLATLMGEEVVYYTIIATAFFYIIIQIVFFGVAHIVSRQQEEVPIPFCPKKDKALPFVALLLFFLGLGLINLDRYFEPQIYAVTLGSYLMALGGIYLLVRHLIIQKYFLLQAAIGFSVLLTFYDPFDFNYRLLAALWTPAIIMGLVTFKRPGYTIRTRLLSVGVPLIFAMMMFSGHVSFHMTFGQYEKSTLQRPEYFPEILKAPENAFETRFMGGDNPSINYCVKEPYPAEEPLAFIIENIEKAGWCELEYSLLNPEIPSSRQRNWSEISSAESINVHVKYQWMTDWINQKEEVLSVYLSYLDPEKHKGEEGMLRVNIQLWQSDSGHGEYLKKYKQLHPEVNEWDRIGD